MDGLYFEIDCDMDINVLCESDDCGYSSDNTMPKYDPMRSTSCTVDFKENIKNIPRDSSKCSNNGEDRVKLPMFSNIDNENNILRNSLDFTNNILIGENRGSPHSPKSSLHKKSSAGRSKSLWKPYLTNKPQNCEENRFKSTTAKNIIKPFKKRNFLQIFDSEASENNVEVSKFNPNVCLMCDKMDFIDDIDNHLIFGTVSCSHCRMSVNKCDDFHNIVSNYHGCQNHVLVFSYSKLDSFINKNDLNKSIDYLRNYLKVTRSVCNNRRFTSSYSYFKSRLLFLEKGNEIKLSENTNRGSDSNAVEKNKEGYQQKIVLHKIKTKDDSPRVNQWIIKKSQPKVIRRSKPVNEVFVHRFSEDCPQCYQTFDIKTFSICLKSYKASFYCHHCELLVAFNSRNVS